MTQSIYLSLKTDESVRAFQQLTGLWDDHPAGQIINNHLMEFLDIVLGHGFENDQIKVDMFEQTEMFPEGITEIPDKEHH